MLVGLLVGVATGGPDGVGSWPGSAIDGAVDANAAITASAATIITRTR